MKSTKIVSSIEELKQMNETEMIKAAEDIRQFLIYSIAKTGGHLGSNLGIVELTMALHKEFDSPHDKLIFDVGHQSYVHKILTGRASEFDKLRQYDGLSGFVKRNESIHDVWEAGHSSTSISAAAGFAKARDMNGSNEDIIAIIGDGSMTNGMAMEALNHLNELNTKVIIIINDNEMSISKNIGFIDNLLKDLQKSDGYYRLKLDIHKTLNKKYFPLGKKIDKLLTAIKHRLKIQISEPHSFFGLMGFKYVGPIDGHNFSELSEQLKFAKDSSESVILHIKTTKGKGYRFAEDNGWHGVSPFNVDTGETISKKSGSSYSKVVSDTVSMMMDNDNDIITITPAMIGGSELEQMKKKFDDRVTDVGIAEEHALTFCAGLALGNKKPFLAIYSTFLQRGYDQLFHDIVRQNCNVVIGIDRAGLVGADGETHQGIYDISFLSHMPHIIITQGKNQYETQDLLYTAFKTDATFVVRYARGGDFANISKFDELNLVDLVWEKTKKADKYIITYGPDVEVYEKLTENIDDIAVINARVIKPVDTKLLDEIKDAKLFVVEEHCGQGNLNSLIMNYYQEINVHVDITAYNLGDSFIEQGDVTKLKEVHELLPTQIIDKIRREHD